MEVDVEVDVVVDENATLLPIDRMRQPGLRAPTARLDPLTSHDDRATLQRFLDHDALDVEIGFGRAHFLLPYAQANRERHIIGFELRRKWCEQLAGKLHQLQLGNVRIIQDDARWVIARCFGPATIDRLFAFFPDPWWKKRHHKRRVFQEPFVQVLHETLKPDGHIHFKTDVFLSLERVKELFVAHGGFAVRISEHSEMADGFLSHREKKCLAQSAPVYSLSIRKTTTVAEG